MRRIVFGEASIGRLVRVSECLTHPEHRLKVGTITGGWGTPDNVAFDVLLEDGSSGLYWHYQLEEIGEKSPAKRAPP